MSVPPRGASRAGCAHCGVWVEVAPGATGPVYCCNGCAAAAAIIEGAGLQRYYDDREAPAPRPTGLDAAALARQLQATAVGDTQVRPRFCIDGLQCAACVWVTEKVLQATPGVASATVRYATGRADVVVASEHLPAALQAIAALGYTPRPADVAPSQHRDRDLLLRLGVASFAAMNVMMLSIGVYLGWWAGMADAHATLLRYVNLALATPVALWAAAPFFQSAWTGLRHRVLSMDLPISLGVAVLYGHGLISTVWLHQEGYLDSLTMLVALLLAGRFVEQRGRRRTAEAATALASRAPAAARREAAGGVETVAAASLQPGDRVLAAMGEELPCDGTVTGGDGLLEMALVTGESEPVRVGPGDSVVAGAVLREGALTVVVTHAGDHTLLARMAAELRDALDRPPAPDATDRIAPWFTGLTLAAAALTFGVWWALAGTGPALEASVAVLVVACPCALSLARPLALAAGLGAAARRGLLFRSGDALLALAEADTLAIDKTGTVTGGVPAITAADDATLRLAAGVERHSIHPVARAIVAEAARRGIAVPQATDVVELPGVGIAGMVDGAPVAVPAGARPGTLQVDGHGEISVADRIRDDAAGALTALASLGLPATLLTGDHADVAARIAAEAGGLPWQAGLRPADKAAWLRAQTEGGRRPLFVGDGLNDGPALAAAHVGVAMGSGAASSVLAADAVIAQAGLRPLVAGVVVARAARDATTGNLRRSLAYNVLAVGAAMAGLVNPLVAALLMPLSSAMVLAGALAVERRTQRQLTALHLVHRDQP